jgi:hypothetical protein
MPVYDRRCDCGWERADCYEPVNYRAVCPECGVATERVWLSPRSFAVHGDDQFIGGRTYENLGHEPVTVYSRAELKREMQARGLQEFVRHTGEQGSDKSKHTTRWV